MLRRHPPRAQSIDSRSAHWTPPTPMPSVCAECSARPIGPRPKPSSRRETPHAHCARLRYTHRRCQLYLTTFHPPPTPHRARRNHSHRPSHMSQSEGYRAFSRLTSTFRPPPPPPCTAPIRHHRLFAATDLRPPPPHHLLTGHTDGVFVCPRIQMERSWCLQTTMKKQYLGWPRAERSFGDQKQRVPAQLIQSQT